MTDQIWKTLHGMATDFGALLPLFAAGFVVFLLFWAAATGLRKLVEKFARSRDESRGAATAVGRLAYIALMLLGALVAATVAFPSMTPGKLFSVLGVGGVAIGFAFKDIFQNLVAGILLLLRQPFRAGDEIVAGKFVGRVESIETRATFLRTYDGQRVIIPNGVIYTQSITVITAYDLLRTQYDVGIGYGDDVSTARRIALEAVSGVEGVLAEPAPDVLLWDLAGASKNLRVRWWTKPQRATVVKVRDRVLQAVAESLSEAGIDLPFPTQQILFHDQTESTDGDRTRQREGWPAGKSPPSARRVQRVEVVGTADDGAPARRDGRETLRTERPNITG